MNALSERTVVVTGSASGIGQAIVEALVRDELVHVVALDRVVTPHTSTRVHGIQVDLTDEDAADQAFARIDALGLPPLAGAVCAAGVQERVPSVEITMQQFHRVLAVHLDGSLIVTQRAARRMPTGGSIVLFSSVAEYFGWPGRVAYAVAKAGISAMARTLAVEWAEQGIRVNAVAPGYVDTPMIHAARERGELSTEPAPLHAVGRLAEPAELAEPAVFLLGAGASFITGETVAVDGGYRIFKVR